MGEDDAPSISIPEVVDYAKIRAKVAENVNIPSQIVEISLDLLLTGNTVPFVARYRKERTNGLDEVQLRNIKKEEIFQ